MAVGKGGRKRPLKQPKRGAIDVKCPKMDESGQPTPFCSHGPTLMFERSVGTEIERFYACSVYRDRKKCRFYQAADSKSTSEDGEKQLRERQMCSERFEPKHTELLQRLKKFKALKGNQRRFCTECGKLVMPDELEDHKGHKLLAGIIDKQLESPSTLLPPLNDKDGAAQFWFTPKCVKFFTNTIKTLKFDSVLCIGAPRIHEGIVALHKKRYRSFLLDIDYRLAQFWSPLKYGPYNFMVNHFYTKLAEISYRRFLAKSKRLLVVIDPPFGAMIEPIASSLQQIQKDWESEQAKNDDEMNDEADANSLPCVETMLIFPYFGEKRIKDGLGADKISMLDYKVEYENHPLFRSASITGKRVSPIRIFTTVQPNLIPLPPNEGYKLCEICKRYVSSENKHCEKCDSCTTKFGRTYVHCKKCFRCVKPSYEHCGKCGKCHLPTGSCTTSPLCSICFSAEHKRGDCPREAIGNCEGTTKLSRKLKSSRVELRKKQKSNPMRDQHGINSRFICGVVEGFYGRPWTTDQRKELFSKMREFGMNTFIYAPKDDLKHRAYWRDPYTVDEADHLECLIDAALSQNVEFVYALSPGIDITYSSTKDVGCVKEKLAQVKSLGCRAFALLFDDIEAAMNDMDKLVFSSFAQAQVSVTNEVFEHLGQPKFLFCPTEYCESRAVPNLTNSDYLNHVGSKLVTDIHVMWTGPRVISKRLTAEHLQRIGQVLKRKPLIWDNLHANDYDPKRVFLGPYAGRSTKIKDLVAGVVTNPNCEYEANFIPIFSLAQWSKSLRDCEEDQLNPELINLDVGNVQSYGEKFAHIDSDVYHPLRVLDLALDLWLQDVAEPKILFKAVASRHQPSSLVAICTTLTATTTTSSFSGDLGDLSTKVTASSSTSTIHPVSSSPGFDPVVSATLQVVNSLTSEYSEPMELARPDGTAGQTVPVVDSLKLDASPASYVSGSETDMNVVSSAGNSFPPTPGTDVDGAELSDPADLKPTEAEEKGNSSVDTRVIEQTEVEMVGSSDPSMSPPYANSMDDAGMQVDKDETDDSNVPSNCSSLCSAGQSEKKEDHKGVLLKEDLFLIAQLFYLPFEHGLMGYWLLSEFKWLKANAEVVANGKHTNSPCLSEEWSRRAAEFSETVKRLDGTYQRLNECPNRSFLFDLFPYVWEILGTLHLLNAFVEWIGLGYYKPSALIEDLQRSPHRKDSKDESGGSDGEISFGMEEPWQYKGGLGAELLHQLPLNTCQDLFTLRPPFPPGPQFYSVRTFREGDRPELMRICQMTSTASAKDQPNLDEEMVELMLNLSIEYSFVMEELFSGTIVGFALGARDAADLHKKLKLIELAKLHENSPSTSSESNGDQLLRVGSASHTGIIPDASASGPFEGLSYVKPQLSTDSWSVPDSLWPTYPSLVMLRVTPSVAETSAPKRLATVILSVLKATGSIGAYVEVPRYGYRELHELCSRLGFFEVLLAEEHMVTADNLYLGRQL